MFQHLPTNSRRTARLLALLTLSLVSLGCSRFTKTKQCRALIAQVNPALDDVLTLTHGNTGSPNSGNYVAAAGRYERLAKQLGPMGFASEEMAQYVAEYTGVLNSAAKSLRSLAASLDAHDSAGAERESRELERITGHERSVVARMDAWCQP